jgi:hypothetical protein
MFRSMYRFQASDDPPEAGNPSGRARRAIDPGERDELAYKVELWDRDGQAIEQVLAVTSSASIGYAAFYAATREFPEAVITLRHNKNIMSKWGSRPH